MRNTIENLIISLLVFIVGASVGGVAVHKADVSTMSRMMETQKQLIKSQENVVLEAINKNTTNVVNEVHNEIEKLKLKNSTLTNEKSDNLTPTIQNNISKPEKKRFRLFKK